MKKTILSLATAAAVLSFGTMAAEAKVKACWIYVGPIGDFGYSYQHHQGLLQVEKELPARVATSSSRPPSASWMRPTRLPASSRM